MSTPHGETAGNHWTAIQITTASSLAAVVELTLEGKISETGFVRQEEIDYDAFLSTRTGELFS